MRQVLFIGTILIFAIFSGCTSQDKTKLQDLIGLEINSQPIQDYLKVLGNPEISKRDDSYYYLLKDKGVELSFTNSSILDAVFLYSEGYSNYRQFKGKLPYGIVITDKRADVEKKLGTPSKSIDGANRFNHYSEWRDKGISVTYNSKDAKDMSASIGSITLFKE